MSTDTDRIVNFCQSFHQFWSLPFQVAVSLYLLHQQVYTATVIDHTVAKKIAACRFYRDPLRIVVFICSNTVIRSVAKGLGKINMPLSFLLWSILHYCDMTAEKHRLYFYRLS